jgi:hypothetical protein
MFTCVTWHYINYMPLHALIIPLLQGNVGFSCLLTAQCHAANMLNTHETLCCRPTRWMVSGFLPHIDPEIAKYPKNREHSISVGNVETVELMEQPDYADLLPMEFADGKTRLTQDAHASCGRHRHYSIQHARVQAGVSSRGKVSR